MEDIVWMEGVTQVAGQGVSILGIIMIIISAILLAVSIAGLAPSYGKQENIFLSLFIALLAINLIIVSIDMMSVELSYRVIISDEVNLKEFMEIYDITNVDGEIYYVSIK